MTSQAQFACVTTPGQFVQGAVAMALDANGNPQAISNLNPLPMLDAYQAALVTTWTSATPLNTAVSMPTAGYDTIVLTVAPPGGLTGGTITFNVFDGTNWIPVKAARTSSYATDSTFNMIGSPGTQAWQVPVAGFPQFQFVLSQAIVGAGNVAITSIVSSAPDVSICTVGVDPASLLPTMGANTVATGLTTYRAFCAGNTTPLAIKTTAGKIHKIECINNAASARYLKLWNLAVGSVTVGTTPPARTILLPASAMTVFDLNDLGMSFSTAITYSITGGFLDSDNTAPTASDVLTHVDYV